MGVSHSQTQQPQPSFILNAGQYLFSSDNDIMLLYRSDGRLLIYNATYITEVYDAKYASNIYGNDPNTMVLDRKNGIYEVYQLKEYKSSVLQQIPPAPSGQGGKCIITQYIKLYDSNDQLYWTSPNWFVTDQRGPYRNVIQKDGNFVIYDANDKPVWATGTNFRTQNNNKRAQGNLDFYSGECTVKSC